MKALFKGPKKRLRQRMQIGCLHMAAVKICDKSKNRHENAGGNRHDFNEFHDENKAPELAKNDTLFLKYFA